MTVYALFVHFVLLVRFFRNVGHTLLARIFRFALHVPSVRHVGFGLLCLLCPGLPDQSSFAASVRFLDDYYISYRIVPVCLIPPLFNPFGHLVLLCPKCPFFPTCRIGETWGACPLLSLLSC